MSDPEHPGAEPVGVFQLLQVLISLQKGVLNEVQRILPIPDQSKQVIENTLFPAGHKDAVSIHVPPSRPGDEVAVLNFPKDHFGSDLKTYSRPEKTERVEFPG